MGKIVSVEPVVFLYFVTVFLSNNLNTSLLLFKACDPSGKIIQQVGSKCLNETKSQHMILPINGLKAVVLQIVPLVLTMFAGMWSDCAGHRRRPLIILPIVGQLLTDAVSLSCVVQWSVSPQLTAAMQTTASAFTGSYILLFNGVNSYVVETTSEEWRTVKFGIVNCMASSGVIIGLLVYGYLIMNVSFEFAYLVAIGLGLVGLVLTFMLIKDSTPDTTDALADNITLCKQTCLYINPIHILRSCNYMMIKRRKGNDTLVLLLVILACAPLTCVPKEGEMTVMYLFLRCKFKWNEADYSYFFAYKMAFISLGTMFTLGILSHTFQISDALIGTIASVFDLLAVIVYSLVSTSWQLYSVVPLELFHGATLMITSSIASKCVELDELGTMNSIKLFMEGTIKSIFIPLYSFVFNYTFETMPNIFFLISVVLTFPLVFIFLFIYYLNQKTASNGPKKSHGNKKLITETS